MRGNTISIRLGRAFIGQTGNLYQYDRGQKLLIEGVDLPEVYQAHFSNAILGRSKPMVGTPEGVDIPDEYLESGMDVHVWIYVAGEDHAETEYHGIIHVTRRAEPTDIQPTPAQATVIDTLISELNDALEEAQNLAEQIPQDIDTALEEAKESGEFDGPKGDPGDPGPRGAAGAGMVYVDKYSQSGGQTTMLGIAEWQYAYRLGAIVPVVIRTTVPNAANLKLMVGTDTAKTCKVYPLPGSGASLQPGIYFLYCVGNQYQLRLDGFQGKINGISVAEAASKAINTTMPTTPSDSYVPTTKLMAEQLAEKYTKPATGIPASDLAEGVIPDPTELIDDDAGEGDTNKVWSADKSASELSDVNFALNGKAPVIISEASGSIASFADGIGGEPLVDCTVQIEPIQSGSGDPAPDNVRPIYGWTGCTVALMGVNAWDEEWVNAKEDIDTSTGAIVTTTVYYFRSKNKIPVIPNTAYFDKNGMVTSGNYRIFFYDAQQHFISFASHPNNTSFTTPANARWMMFRFASESDTEYGNNISINYPATDHDYHAYTGTTYPISWQTAAGTVYGGSLDVTTGVLTVTHRFATFNGSEAWNTNSGGTYFILWNQDPSKSNDDLTQIANWLVGGGGSYQSYGKFRVQTNGALCVGKTNGIWNDTDAFKTYLASNPLQICYELSEPQTYQLTPTEITALTESCIWADCGGTAVSYKADTKGYIDGHSGGQQITVDSALSSSSTNPVQNKVINTALAGKEPKHNVTTVSGTTPSITGVANTQYKCGECSTLTITPPASGCVDVIFTSGSTPTVLTVTPPTGMTMMWANGFDPTSLEADTTYEINILDGCLGVAGTWT